MARKMKIRAWDNGKSTSIKAIIFHPMETGLRKDKKTGKLIPAHHITEVVATAGDKTVLDAVWGGAISKNPYLSFKYSGAKGDALTLSWTDNQGNSDSAASKVK